MPSNNASFTVNLSEENWSTLEVTDIVKQLVDFRLENLGDLPKSFIA